MTPLRLAAAVALLWGAVAAHASTVLPADFPDIVTRATLIVRGRVTDVRAVRSVRGEVETVATILVDAVLKGDAGSFVSMRVPGGVIGRYRTYMPGAPRVVLHDAGVYLLTRAPGGAWWPVGLSAGIYRVTLDDGRLMVMPPVIAGVTTASTGRVVRGDVRRRTLPLGEFESLVGLVVRGGPDVRLPRGSITPRGGVR